MASGKERVFRARGPLVVTGLFFERQGWRVVAELEAARPVTA
jgi:hypothetical protein